MATITVNNNEPSTIDVNALINSSSDGNWIISGSTIVHNNVRPSYMDRAIDALKVGNTYEVTYTVSAIPSCTVRVYLGDTAGTIRSTTGTFVETLSLVGLKKVRFWANGNVTITYVKITEVVQTVIETPVNLQDTTIIENKSWTFSYYPILQQWVSSHSYIPNNYLIHPTKFLAKRNDTQLKISTSGTYGSFFDVSIKPFIVESVFNDSPLSSKVFDNITVNLISEDNKISTNKFFDKLILSTEYQCSGEIILDTTNLTKKERNWMINKFSDLTNSSSEKLFSTDWDDTKTQYPIDKVVNTDKIDVAKPWYQQARFRDKFLAVRFIENNLQNQKIIVKFVSSIFRQSQR